MPTERLLAQINGILSLATEDDIKAQCVEIAQELGYRHVYYSAYFPPIEATRTIHNYPVAWATRYRARNYVRVDPTIKHASTSPDLLCWQNIQILEEEGNYSSQRMVCEAQLFGLRHGVTQPVHAAGAEWGVMNLSSVHEGLADSHAVRIQIAHFAYTTHRSLRAVHAEQIQAQLSESHLTDREVECLRWTAKGKTAWEISRILSVSESTVTFHLKNSIAKMGCANRPHAVAKALAQGRITLT